MSAPAPRQVIWRKDWKEESQAESLSPAQIEARKTRKVADSLKSAGDYDDAENAYRTALELDPRFAYASYQRACNFALAGKAAEAKAAFDKAVELKFSDYPVALEDDELGSVRLLPDFSDKLKIIRATYIQESAKHVGQPVAFLPVGGKPLSGWPVMLLLHGYGDSNVAYFPEAEAWSKLGFLTVAVPGSMPSDDGRFIWSQDSSDVTHRDLQAIIHSPLFQNVANTNQIYLLGFSQGAMHAANLVMLRPKDYAGAVLLSPGGQPLELEKSTTKLDPKIPRSIFMVHGTEEPHAPLARMWAGQCRESSWRFSVATHPGGHHFPDDWDAMRVKIHEFLVK